MAEQTAESSGPGTVIGRYVVYGEIAHGGMATVHFGRLVGPVGFSRTVAIKRLHAHLAKDPDFVTMFLDEARVAARIRHPNVVPTLDVVSTHGQLLLVMEYVQGEPLSRLIRAAFTRGERIPLPVVCSILVDALNGLHAAHEAVNEKGEALGIVHRDVSPQNVLVGVDGVARVLDFGVAKAVGRLHSTREGKLKGKIAYMPPEQVRSGEVTRAADIYAASAVLWEALVGRRMIAGFDEVNVLEQVLFGEIAPPSKHVPDLPPALDEIVMRGLARDPKKRFATAREMARELEKRTTVARASEVGEWVETLAGEALTVRAREVADIESISHVTTGHGVGDLLAGLRRRAEELPDGGESVTDRRPAGTELETMSASSVGLQLQPDGTRRRVALIGGTVAGVLCVAILLAARVASRAPLPPAAVLPSSAPPAIEIPRPPDTVAVEPGPSASAKAITAQPPSPRSVAPRSATAGKPGGILREFPEGTSASPPRGRPGCNPPYTVDPDGTKHYKVDCL